MRGRLCWLIPVLLMVAATGASGGWRRSGHRVTARRSVPPALWAFDADMRRAHPQERAFQLSVGDHDTARNGGSGKHVRWALSGTLTRRSDEDGDVFDCDLAQRGDGLTVTFPHGSLR